MKQLVAPNLTVQGKAGWCLWLAQEVWGVPHLYPKAIDAWNAGNQRTDPLPDVAVPVYWTFYDVQDATEYGHIATYLPNRGIYSSPFNSNYGAEWYPSIQSVTERINKIYGANCRYLGWSETLSGVQLVMEEDMLSIDQVDKALKMGLRREPTQEELNNQDFQNSAGLLIETLWNNGGADLYAQTNKTAELTRMIGIKDDEIKKLTAQLAVQSNDTELLNGFGAWLTKIIARLGVKG